MWNVETPSWSGQMTRWADREEGRTPPAGTGWPKKRMPVAERQQETDAVMPSPPAVGPDNWPDTGYARARKGADVGQVSLWRRRR